MNNTKTFSINEDQNEVSYFDPISDEENNPLHISSKLNDKYLTLEKYFNRFFPEHSLSLAKEKSTNERDQKGLIDSSFIYGEVTFRSIAYIIEYAKNNYPIKEGTFYDLGSGTGKGIIGASLCHAFNKYIGIELLENLYQLSLNVKTQFNEEITKIIDENKDIMPIYPKGSNDSLLPLIEIKNGDFLKEKWENPSFIFANSTCFSQELMCTLARKCEIECKAGTIVVTFTKKLPELSSSWETQTGFKRIMSWGIATVFIHWKKVKAKIEDSNK